MALTDTVQRVRIYLNRDDQWEGGPRYVALLDQLRRIGATGATALQGLAGFGPGTRRRITSADRSDQHQPVVVEWIDRDERVARLLPMLADLLGDALVTVESIPIYQATLRARGPFTTERGVGDLMRRPAPAVSTQTQLTDVLHLLVTERLGTLPVIAALGQTERLGTLPVTIATGQLVGLIAEQDLAWRAGLHLKPALLPLLTPEEREAILQPLVGRLAHEVMNTEPRSVGVNTAIAQALVTMIEWGYAQLPVVERDGRLVGLLEPEQVLREVLAQAQVAPEAGTVRDAEPPTPVRLILQTVVAQVTAGTRLNLALAQLLATPGRHLLVVADDGRLVGTLDEASALRGLAGPERAAFLTALQRPHATPATALPGGDRPVERLSVANPPSIAVQASILDAAQRLLDLGLERLAVVDAEQQLLGIIARGGLIRALIQQSQ